MKTVRIMLCFQNFLLVIHLILSNWKKQSPIVCVLGENVVLHWLNLQFKSFAAFLPIAVVRHPLWMWESSAYMSWRFALEHHSLCFLLVSEEYFLLLLLVTSFLCWIRARVCVLKDMLKSTSAMSGSGSVFYFFVIACSSLLPSMGLPYYGVLDGSQFIKQCNDLVGFLHCGCAQVLTLCLNKANWILQVSWDTDHWIRPFQ